MKSAVGPLLTDIQLFDVYQDASLGDGKKSLAVTITLTPQKATLSETEIEAVSTAVVEAAVKNCGAVCVASLEYQGIVSANGFVGWVHV